MKHVEISEKDCIPKKSIKENSAYKGEFFTSFLYMNEKFEILIPAVPFLNSLK